MLLFIYGTLKRGCSNHSWMQKHHFLFPAKTIPGFALYLIEDYPGLVPDPLSSQQIHGEIWEISDHKITDLDHFEGVHEQLYARRPIPLAPPHDSLLVQAYFYLRDVSKAPKLSPNWSNQDIPTK